MIYLIKKKNWMLQGIYSNLKQLNEKFKDYELNKSDYFITQDISMNYISRTTYVDGKVIYNNKKFWTTDVFVNKIAEEFENHEVLDFMGLPVSKERFLIELDNNVTRCGLIDGTAGEVDYNITVGNEFISLFREECIKTKFETITPMQIGAKLKDVISFVVTGSFREAKMVLKTLPFDDFLTAERLQKYEDMLDAADAITYATDEEYYYTAGKEV